VSSLKIGDGASAPRKNESMGVMFAGKIKQKRMLISYADPNFDFHSSLDWVAYCEERYGTDSEEYGEAVNWDERYTGDL
jgi:hypothetical protein